MNILKMYEVLYLPDNEPQEEYSEFFNTLDEAIDYACKYPINCEGRVYINSPSPEFKSWRIR